METEARQKLIEKLSAIDLAVTLPQLRKAVEEMLKFSVNLQQKTETEIKTIAESVKTAISRIETLSQAQSDEAKAELQDSCDKMMSDMRFQCEAMISEAQQKIDTVKSGEDGADGVSGTNGIDGKDGSPDTAEEVRDKLETLEGEERLDASAIKGLEKYDLALDDLKNRPIPSGVAGRGVGVQDEGIDLGLLKILNFTGAGVSVTRIGDTAIISITGGGAGSTTPAQQSGTIVGLTNIVTLTNAPVANTLMLYINEAFVDPSRYSLVGLVVTMGSALDASYSGLRYTAIYQY